MTGNSNGGSGGYPPGGYSSIGQVSPPLQQGPSGVVYQQLLQELVHALQTLGTYTKANLGQQASGDISGSYPGPILVISTHLAAPLPVAQGGTGNTTGEPSGAAGGDLSGSYPSPTVTSVHLTSALSTPEGGTGLTSGTSGGVLAFLAPALIGSSGLLAQYALMVGGGAGVAPSTLTTLGSATTVLHGNVTGEPTFGPVETGDIAAAAVTYDKIQNETATTLLGNPTGSVGSPEEITLGASLSFSGTTLDVGVPASWTPTDASGATLVFTGVSASSTRVGNMMFAYGTLTYPITASGADAAIGGLPIAAANAAYGNTPFVVGNSSASFGSYGVVTQNANTFSMFNAVSGAQLTNTNLSGVTVRFLAAYPIA